MLYMEIYIFHQGCLPDKCVRYYSSRLFSPFFGFVLVSCLLIHRFIVSEMSFDKSGLYRLDYKIGSDYEMMVRFFRKHKTSSRYVPKDFVTMWSIFAASNSNTQSRLTLIKEDVKACRDNGIYTNELFICLKFLYKIFQFESC